MGRRVVVVMPAYNAEATLERTWRDVPQDVVDEIILGGRCKPRSHGRDRASGSGSRSSSTRAIADTVGIRRRAITRTLERACDVVAMIHPDCQYDARLIPLLVGFHRSRHLRYRSRLAHPEPEGGACGRDASVEVRREPCPNGSREPGPRPEPRRLSLRLPRVRTARARDDPLRGELERLPLRFSVPRPGRGLRVPDRRCPRSGPVLPRGLVHWFAPEHRLRPRALWARWSNTARIRWDSSGPPSSRERRGSAQGKGETDPRRIPAGHPAVLRPPPLGWRSCALVYGILLVGVGVVTWPLARHPASLWPPHHDARVFTWVMASLARRLFDHPLTLFHGNAFYPNGESLSYTEPLLVPTLIGLPGFLWGNPILTYNLLLLFLWPLNGLAMAWVAHALTGSRPAALLAGVVFCLSPYFTEYYLEFQMLLAYLVPIVLLRLDSVAGDRSPALACPRLRGARRAGDDDLVLHDHSRVRPGNRRRRVPVPAVARLGVGTAPPLAGARRADGGRGLVAGGPPISPSASRVLVCP